MKLSGFLLTIFSVFCFSSSAQAGRLVFWRMNTTQDRFVFTTNEAVQPKAFLIANPTRLVIDLPGTTLDRSTINQNFNGLINNLRIGQFDANTTRLVIELAPGYTFEPEDIKIRGSSPTDWSIELPKPEPTTRY